MPVISNKSVKPGFNLPIVEGKFNYVPFPTGDPEDKYYNFENEEWEVYNEDADAAGCYEYPSDWDSDDLLEEMDELVISHHNDLTAEQKFHDEQTKNMSPQEKEIYKELQKNLAEEKKANQNPLCDNDFNCVDHCHCDDPGYTCFFCKLSALGLLLKVKVPLDLQPKDPKDIKTSVQEFLNNPSNDPSKS